MLGQAHDIGGVGTRGEENSVDPLGHDLPHEGFAGLGEGREGPLHRGRILPHVDRQLVVSHHVAGHPAGGEDRHDHGSGGISSLQDLVQSAQDSAVGPLVHISGLNPAPIFDAGDDPLLVVPLSDTPAAVMM